MDYYAILGVHPTAEDIVIRAAYKALAQRYHPDRFAGSQDEAHRRMSDLTKAYEVLADPVRRQKYDRRRLTYTQSVATYFNSSPRDAPLALDPLDLRSSAARRKRSRLALSALMAAVVVLSAFNLFQYSTQLKDWLSASTPAPASPADAMPRRATEAAVVGAVSAVPADAPIAAPPAKPRNLPIGQGSTSAQDAVVPDAPTPGPAPQHINAAPESRLGKGPGEIAARPSSADASHAAAVLGAAPPALAPMPKDDRRSRPATPGIGARIAPGDGRISTPTPVPASDPCRDTVAALGLCSPNTTARNK